MFSYSGLTFKTRLEAKWAAFFDRAGWRWWSNPVAEGDWAPDFRVEFDCTHSECNGSHSLLVSVLPIDSIDGFGSHPCLQHNYGSGISACGGAAFGSSPKATRWEIVHGAGGGTEDLYFRCLDADLLWHQAEEDLRNTPQ